MDNLVDLMNKQMVNAIIETLPVELTIIDSKDEVVGWNKHKDRIFKRATNSIGVNFRQCHPVESLPLVERIVDEMRQRKRDKAVFWIDMPVTQGGKPHKILIEFYALRDPSGNYIGCMECTQDIEEMRNLQGQKRLLD